MLRVPGADKDANGYIPAYLDIAAKLGPAARVCEIGVLSGDSLRLWQELYPQGLVAGVDSADYRSWPDGTIKIVCDQASDRLPELLSAHAPAWDLIVDDASHIGSLTGRTFDMLWPLVAPGGYYVIEDWFIGLPLFAATGRAVAGAYDPGMLYIVQDLLTRLDEPYRAGNPEWYGPRSGIEPGKTDVESVHCTYGLAIVHKYPEAP